MDGSSITQPTRDLERESRRETTRTLGWRREIGLLNDYVRVPFANGSSFASQFLYRELGKLGARVSVIGPADPEAAVDELPERRLPLRSMPLRNQPGVQLALPSAADVACLRAQRFDLILGQTCNALMEAGVYLREADGVPLVMVNTVHLPSVYNALLPERLVNSPAVKAVFERTLVPLAEAQTANAYNRGDGLVVLSEGMRRYWRERGVVVPIHVIPRAIEVRIFDGVIGADPFPPSARRGARLLVVCRHVREKGVGRLLELVAKGVFPRIPDATLTLVGDGPDRASFERRARELGIDHRCHFIGEIGLRSIPRYYEHADVFVYASLSETYGQVVSEALYCGLPVVALRDEMGVSDQVSDSEDGFLVDPGPDAALADRRFADAVVHLLTDPSLRRAFGTAAKARGSRRSDPGKCVGRYLDAFESAREHRDRTWRPRAIAPAPIGPLARWGAMHGLIASLGLLREPVGLHVPSGILPDWSLRGVR